MAIIAKKGKALDTLAQLPPKPKNKLPDKGTLLKRARAKYHTNQTVLGLVNRGSVLDPYYWNAWHCCSTMKKSGNKITSTYCNTRICHVCNRIRTAKMMNGYLPQLKGRSLKFVTLTIPNVEANCLRFAMEQMIKTITNIIRNLREKKNISVNGIRKLEVTYNADKKNYHPHFHLLVDAGSAEILEQWLSRNSTSKRIAQDITDADQNSLNELFKYSTKITEGKKTLTGKEILVYPDALDVIMVALRGLRIIQSFGNIKKVSEDVDQIEVQEYDGLDETTEIYQWLNHDWVSLLSNEPELLTGYEPPPVKYKYVFNNST